MESREKVNERASPMGERIMDKIDALSEDIKEMSSDIRKLLQYVIVIGVLNGSVTIGKVVDSAVSMTEKGQTVVKGGNLNVGNGATDTR